METIPRNSSIEDWLERNLNALVISVIVAGFVIRVAFASRSFFNADEAVYYLFSAHSSLWQAYKSSLNSAHPPLLILFLYFWKFMGRNELVLRLPSVLAGAGFCWFTYRWLEKAFSKTAGFIAVLIAAFSPALIGISIEVRQYSLLLFFMSAALYFMEVAIQESSLRKMLWFVLFEYLAVLTQYSAVFFVAAAGVYVLVRILEGGVPRTVVAWWVAGQCGAAAMCAALFVTHIWKVRNLFPLWSGPYNQYYFHGDYADIFTFLCENTPPVFHFFFGQGYLAWTMLVLWLAALATLLAGGLLRNRSYRHSVPLSLLLFVPFLTLWAAAIAGKYPYYADRHIAFLAPFVLSAVSALLATLAGQRLWAGMALAAVVCAVLSLTGYTQDSFPITQSQERERMTAAVRYVQKAIPGNEPILLDYQSGLVAAYYLCSLGEGNGFYESASDLTPFQCGGHAYAALNYRTWKLTEKDFPAKFHEFVELEKLKPGSRVWVVQLGWWAALDSDLRDNVPAFRCLDSTRFGKEIVIFPLAVGSELSPTPGAGCGN